MDTSDINLRLGDIIEIIAPSDTNLNKKQFYIDYIDDKEMTLLQNNGEKPQLHFCLKLGVCTLDFAGCAKLKCLIYKL